MVSSRAHGTAKDKPYIDTQEQLLCMREAVAATFLILVCRRVPAPSLAVALVGQLAV